jgi:hypothetical protein
MNSMKMSWQTEADRLVCRWFEVGEHLQYNPCWIQDTSTNGDTKKALPSVVVLARLSPLGRGGWCSLDRLR